VETRRQHPGCRPTALGSWVLVLGPSPGPLVLPASVVPSPCILSCESRSGTGTKDQGPRQERTKHEELRTKDQA
jgi:hypothetical protein